MFTFLKYKAVSALVALHFGFASLLGFAPAPAPQIGGVTFPTVVALFTTSLASKVTSTASTMTLVSGTDKEGVALSGTYGFVIDEGTSSEEFVVCSATSTALTSCVRGVSVTNGQTAVTALQKEHRRGASIKITNFPQLALITKALNGQQGLPNKLYYTDEPSWDLVPASHQLVTWDKSKAYADSLANTGAADATLTLQGLSEMATVAEINAGTGLGGTLARLFVNPSYLASSSYGLNIPTTNEKAGLAGSLASASAANKFLTQASMPPGIIQMYASASAPSGWLIADGSAVSRTTYANLFAVIKTFYGAGNGSTTFNLPNFTGRSPTGITAASASYDTLGETGGQATHIQTTAELAAHTHTVTNNYTGTGAAGLGNAGATSGQITTDSAGSSAAFNVHDPYIIVNFIIKY